MPSPDDGDGDTQWSAWDVGRAASKPWPAAQSHASERRGIGGGRRAKDTATGRRELEWSLALYQLRLQQVLGLTRVEAHGEQRRHCLKVVGLLPVAGRTSGVAEAGYEGEDESKKVPSTVRWHLTFTP